MTKSESKPNDELEPSSRASLFRFRGLEFGFISSFVIRHSSLVICLLLAGASLAVYWPVTRFEFVNLDDSDYITYNFHVRQGLTWKGAQWAFTTGRAANWHPLTWLSHMLDVQLFGMRAGGHHLTSLVLHVANALLLFLVFRQMTAALWRSAFVASLFALHPLHVES